MNPTQFIEKSKEFFSKNGFEIVQEGDFSFQKMSSYSYMHKNVKAGPFRGNDHYFLFIPDEQQTITKQDIDQVHQTVRKYVNSKIKTPRAFRFRVPNIISVFISNKTPDDETVDYIQTMRPPWQGGEIHNVVYIDTQTNLIYSHGKEVYRVSNLYKIELKKISPSNRSFYFIRDLCMNVFGNNFGDKD
jgi:hypothetical protein